MPFEIEEHMPYTGEQKIWRYMDLAKYLDLLRTQSLYLSSLTAFEDPWEGATSSYNFERDLINSATQSGMDIGSVAQMLAKHEDFAASQRQAVYVSCWHANDYESEAMWKLYGMTGNSIAIESSIERLASSSREDTSEDGPTSLVAVRYRDLAKQSLPHEDAFNMLSKHAYKRLSFQHEREVRLIHLLIDTKKMSTGSNSFSYDLAPTGRPIAVDLEMLVSRVVVSPKAQPWFREVVLDATKKYLFNFSIDESEMNSKPTYGSSHYPMGAAPKWGSTGPFG